MCSGLVIFAQNYQSSCPSTDSVRYASLTPGGVEAVTIPQRFANVAAAKPKKLALRQQTIKLKSGVIQKAWKNWTFA